MLISNQSIGGQGNSASGSSAVFAGLGSGGGIFNYLGNFNSPYYGSLTISLVNVSDSLLTQNLAQGGGGGIGEGGGIANMVAADTTVSSSTISQNRAVGVGGGGLGGVLSTMRPRPWLSRIAW